MGVGKEGSIAAGVRLQQLVNGGNLNASVSYDIAKESFCKGTSPFFIAGPWQIPDQRTALGASLMVCPVPNWAGSSFQAQPLVGVRRMRGKNVYWILLIIPFMLPGVLMTLIWKAMLNTDFGLVNQVPTAGSQVVRSQPRQILHPQGQSVDLLPLFLPGLVRGVDRGSGSVKEAAYVDGAFPDRFAISGATTDLPPRALAAEWDDEVIHIGPETPRQLFGGDLDGIGQHLDHLVELGANVLYMTPVFPARSNHRYNASSFAQVDPLLTGDQALIPAAQDVHRRGMRIVGDLTTNHSGADFQWFTTALGNSDADERRFYYVADDGSYAAWLGHESLPKFALESPVLREMLFGPRDSIVARWLPEPFGCGSSGVTPESAF